MPADAVVGTRAACSCHHLQKLREADLVSASPVGRSNRYRLARADLDELATLIGNLEPEPEVRV
jgi:DNA-binding transcriptional ArsR family regulator